MSEESKTNIISFGDHARGEGSQAGGRALNLLPECPEYLSDEAKAHWPDLVQSLGSHGIINEIDKDMLGVYCGVFAEYAELYAQVRKDGYTQNTKNNYVQEHPTYTAYKGTLKTLLSYAKQLGLTPPARAALKVADPGQEKLNF